MRVGEAIRLDRDDVDWNDGVLTIVAGKFGRCREVPLHPATTAALGRYARRRDVAVPGPPGASFFISSAGTRLIPACVRRTFGALVRAGLRPRSAGAGPGSTTSGILRRRDPAGLVPRRRRRAGPAAAAVDLPGPRRSRPQPTGTWKPPPSCSPWPRPARSAYCTDWEAPDERARPRPARVLHRPADPPAPRQPAHRCRLPGHLPAAAGLRPARTGKPPSRLELADLDATMIAAFLDHLTTDRQTPPRPATPGWPRSTRCSATPRCAPPSTPPSSSGYWPSPTAAPTAP